MFFLLYLICKLTLWKVCNKREVITPTTLGQSILSQKSTVDSISEVITVIKIRTKLSFDYYMYSLLNAFHTFLEYLGQKNWFLVQSRMIWDQVLEKLLSHAWKSKQGAIKSKSM